MDHRSHRTYLAVFAVILMALIGAGQNAFALSITPIRFEINGDPGDTVKGEILLINETSFAETYYASYSNFEAQGESGSPAFVDPKEGLGTWIRTELQEVTLAPRQQKVVPFTVTIPNEAEPGGHFAVIFWGTAPPGRGGGVAVGAKTGVLVLLSVNGEVREDAGLLNFNIREKRFWHSTLPVHFEYRLKNDGGDRIKPLGKIIIRNTIFWPTEKLDANPVIGNVLPGSVRKFNVDWIRFERPGDYLEPTGLFKKFWGDVSYQWKNFAVGLYSANLKIAYGSGGEESRGSAFFFVFPWQLVLVMLLVIAVAYFGGRKLINRYNKYIIEKAGTGEQSPPGSSHG
jgi:hypothetical protein